MAMATVIDRKKCIGCGQCVRVCPSRTLALVEGKAAVVGDRSMQCGHCEAVCPVGAARVTTLDPDMAAFASFEADNRWLAHGQADPAQLLRLMASRRSCRNYQERPVPRELLLDLVKAGVSAPSDTNCQAWTFTILPSRAAVLSLARGVGDFFAELNRLAGQAWLREGLALLGRRELQRYHRDHARSVSEALAEWQATGRERLFHGPPPPSWWARPPGLLPGRGRLAGQRSHPAGRPRPGSGHLPGGVYRGGYAPPARVGAPGRAARR